MSWKNKDLEKLAKQEKIIKKKQIKKTIRVIKKTLPHLILLTGNHT